MLWLLSLTLVFLKQCEQQYKVIIFLHNSKVFFCQEQLQAENHNAKCPEAKLLQHKGLEYTILPAETSFY